MGKLKSTRVVDPHASKIVSGFRAPEFIGVNKIWPIVPVSSETGKFMEFCADASVLRKNIVRALGDDRKRIEMRVGSGSFVTAEYGIEVPLYDRELRNVVKEREEDYRLKKSILAEKGHQLAMEVTVAGMIQDPANYDVGFTTALAGATQWKQSTSTPYANLRAWLRTIAKSLLCKVSDLSVALGDRPWEALQEHADTKEKTKYVGKDSSPEWLTGVLGCKSTDLLSGYYLESVDPTAPDNVTGLEIWGDSVVVYREVDVSDPSAPLWGAVPRHEDYPVATEYRDEPRSADIYAVDDNWGVLLNSKRRGFCATDVSGLTA
jgi:hypothetical protein